MALRTLAFAVPVALLGAGVPALKAAVDSKHRTARPAGSSEVLPGGPTAPAERPVTRPDPRAVPAPKVVGEAYFDVTLPPGWSGGEIDNTSRSEGGYDAKRVWRYADEAGNFFVVATDPDGSDYGYDQFWHYRVEDSSFRQAKVFECEAGPEDPFCGRGDDRLDVFIIWEEGGSAQIGGHAYYFMAGNPADEGADTAPFKQILESIRPR